MSAKCIICHNAFVAEPGQMCASCRMKRNQNSVITPNAVNNFKPVESSVVNSVNPTVNTQFAGKFEHTNTTRNVGEKRRELTGVVHNVKQNDEKESFVKRWIYSLISGYPFSLSKTQYTFTLHTGSAYNPVGASGVSVIFYGDSRQAFLNNNSNVRVSGKKINGGVYMAKDIYGENTAFHMHSKGTLSSEMVRIITLALIMLLAGALYILIMDFKSIDFSKIISGDLKRLCVGVLLSILSIAALIKGLPFKRLAFITLMIGAAMIYPPLLIIIILILILRLFFH